MTPTQDFATQRKHMVRQQLAARGIHDPRVLEAMGAIPRESFVPEDRAHEAYHDCPLPIGGGQTISQPYIVGLMTQLLELQGPERVLEVGAGCGYQSAILASLAAEVCALEIDDDLHREAVQNLARLGITNVDLRTGNGFAPWPGGGSFDAILVACAPTRTPAVLSEQLRPGGRLVLPEGPTGEIQSLHRIRRNDDGTLTDEEVTKVRFVPMRD